MSFPTFIITNGESAVSAIKNAEIKAEFLSWDDILHDGPVINKSSLKEISEIRAQFISDIGFSAEEEAQKRFEKRDNLLQNINEYNEVVLWFEHDLYDQLQLIQLLHYFSLNGRPENLYLVCEDQYIGESSPELLTKNFNLKTKISDSVLKLGSKIWETFSGESPKELEKLLENKNSELPFINDAIKRLLEEFPSELNGLSRSENQILKIVEDESKTPGELFKEFLSKEDPKYHGDWTVFRYIHLLCNLEHPLLKYSNGTKNFPPENEKKYFDEKIEITPKGREVLNNRKNNLSVNGIDKWIGGIHLNKNNIWIRKSSDGKLIKLIM